MKLIKKIFEYIRVSTGFLLLASNTLFVFILLYPIGLIKKYIASKSLQITCLKCLHSLGNLWISINYLIVKLISGIKWNVHGLNKLSHLNKDSWYMLVSNHQSWNDILVLQFLLKKNLPFQKYLVKEKMRKFPVMGFVWEAIDCPFLKRKSLKTDNNDYENNAQNDLDLIKDMCNKFKLAPATIGSFIEGTRFTFQKHKELKSNYKNLLNPKCGGLAAILHGMKDEINYIIDVSLCYKPRLFSFWDLFAGNINQVTAYINVIEIPAWLKQYFDSNSPYSEYKHEFETWMHEIWHNKDKLISEKCYN